MLRTRVITAVIAIVALAAVLFTIPPAAAKVVLALVVLAGAWEWSGFLGNSAPFVRYAYVLIIMLLMAMIVFFLPGDAMLLLQIACGWWFLAFLWTFFYPTPIPLVVRWICGALVLLPMFVALKMLYQLSPEMLLFALLIVWAADIGAFFSGKMLGRVKLAPSISPGKTWEGVFGGLLLVTGLAALAAGYFSMPVAVLIPFCVAVAGLSVVGDLTVSMFKRTAGVKDSGKLFPGHGGVLDRVDSVSAATPLFALGLHWLELV